MLSTVVYPRLNIATSTTAAAGQAGGVLLTEAIRASDLDRARGEALLPWRKPNAVHDPGKVILDLAVTLASGGDSLADVAVMRAEPGLYGPVASDPTVSRVIAALAADAPAALRANNTARATARSTAWALADDHAPDHPRDAKAPLVIALDATLVTAHSEKEQAAPTFKRGFGFHPLCAFLDHGGEGTGESWRSCCARATQGRIQRPITSPSSPTRSLSFPAITVGPGAARRSWSVPTEPAAPRPSSTGTIQR